MDREIQARIEKFKSDLHLPTVAVIRKHIIFGDCWVFGNDKYYELKADVAEHFHVHPNEVLVVGSAKLGFSIAPTHHSRKELGKRGILWHTKEHERRPIDNK